MSEIEDRRQRAFEAFHDALGLSQQARLRDAIEVATRVKLTPELIAAFGTAWHAAAPRRAAALRVAFEAAGFEVEL